MLILNSASVRLLLQLGETDLSLLVNIGCLSPPRQFYPADLKVMQQVKWRKVTGFLSQHSRFYVVIKVLLEQATMNKQLDSPGCPAGFVQSLARHTDLDQDLLTRDLVHSAWSRVSGFGAEDVVATHDRTYKGRDRNWTVKRSRRLLLHIKLCTLWRTSIVPRCGNNAQEFQKRLWWCFEPASVALAQDGLAAFPYPRI